MRTNDGLIDYLRYRGVLYDPSVEEAMRRVDRLAFVEPRYQKNAYEDKPAPTGFSQTISAPHMVALMTQHLSVSRGMKVLEVGLGSGYQAAILAELVGPEGEVHSIERIPQLAESAEKRLYAYSNIRIHVGNGIVGLKRQAPFDRILVTAAAGSVPQALAEQLDEGGRMVIPLARGAAQRLTLAEKIAGSIKKTDLGCNCLFVPLVG